jgi:hypothetical protein
MQKKMLRTSGLLTSVILLVCGLALPLSAKDKKQVTRPLKGLGLETILVTPISPTLAIFHNEEDGNATLAGLYHNVGDGTMSLETGQILTGDGTVTAANGDTIHWFWNGYAAIFDRGTGRFENASGFMVMNILSQEMVPNGDGTFTLTVLYQFEGELTY